MSIQSCQLYIPVVVYVLLGSPFADGGETEARLKSIKSRLPFISTGDILYRREPRDFTRDKDQVVGAFQTLMELESTEIHVTELVELTNHSDPDIRALAVLGLVAQESREVVPVCIRLLNDNAQTLPLQQDLRSIFDPNALVATEPQKISDISRRILGMVGCPQPYDRSKVEAWWAERKENPDWLAWYEFLYHRATQGFSPIPASAKERIARFRKQLVALPAQTKAWVLLYLADDVFMVDGEWHNNFATMDEMLEAARSLGPEALLTFLKNGQRQGLKPPNLNTKSNGARFIITNAIHLFRKEHTPSLLELKQFTAAADADPTMVRSVVEAGLRYYAKDYQNWDRAKLMAALAVHGDAADRVAAATWFYSVPNVSSGSSDQSIFIGAVRYRRPQHWREIVKPLVAHQKFDQLKPIDVVYLALLVQKLGNVPLAEAINDGQEDSSRLRNELRKLFDVAVVESKKLSDPQVILSRPVWSVDLASRAHSLAVSDDGRLLAVGMDESNPAVKVLDAEDGRTLNDFREPTGNYFRVEFVSEQKLVFAPSLDNRTGNLLTWTVGQTAHQAVLINPEVDPFTNSRPQVIPSRQEGRLALLDTRSLGWFENTKTVWRHDRRTRGFSVFENSPDAKWIAINDGFRQLIELINTRNGKVEFSLEGLSTVPAKACFSPDSKQLLALGEDNRQIIWSVETGRELARYEGSYARSGPVRFSTDGNSFFAVAGWGHVGAFSTIDGSSKFAFPYHVTGTEFNGNYVASVLPSRDGQHLFALIMFSKKLPPNFEKLHIQQSRIQKWALPAGWH